MSHRFTHQWPWLNAFPKRHILAVTSTLLLLLVFLLLISATEELNRETQRLRSITVNPPKAPQLVTVDRQAHNTLAAHMQKLQATYFADDAHESPDAQGAAKLAPSAQNTKNLEAKPELDYLRVQKGDTLSDLFAKEGLGGKWVLAVLKTEHGKQLKRIVPGDRLGFALVNETTDASTKKLSLLRYYTSFTNYIEFTADENDRFTSKAHSLNTEILHQYAEGRIENSLFYDANKAGLSEKTIMEFAGLFAWDIDFALDLREGDQFRVLYQQEFYKGNKLRDGDILLAEFTNQGKVFRAIRYEDSVGNVGYYTPEGLSVRKAFIRSPVDFARISSGFNLRRKHPVLHTIRAHRGVDYAAAPGTPIKATGKGKVKFIGRKGGFGKVIILQHGTRYTTLYAHMRAFKRGLRTGSRVKQGQVIGFVGSTGLASGPHLHYEFRVDGVHRDPLRVKLPNAHPIAKKERKAFLKHSQQVLAMLATQQENMQIAINDG